MRLAAVLGEPGGRQLVTACLLFLGTSLFSKRERSEIISAILTAVGEGVTAKTRLMFKTNLDTRALRKYLDFLTERGFLREDEGRGGRYSYSLTETGRRFLERYREVDGMLSNPSGAPRVPDQAPF